MGAVVSITLQSYGYDSTIVEKALWMTLAIAFVMTAAAAAFPKAFINLGLILLISLLSIMIVEIIASFIWPALYNLLDYIAIGIFALYIGFDWARAGRLERTLPNAIFSGTQLFVDLINIFLRLLRIFGKSSKRD